jgi:beta-galactosidase
VIRTSFDRDWYVASDGSDATAVGPVTLPYDAMLFEERDPSTRNAGNTGYFPGGVYRYTKTFTPADAWKGKVVILEFEGVYQRSRVFLNGELVGGRPSGYALFHVELSKHLRLGETNILEVVADNSEEPNARWYTGSGIYRPVSLLVGDRVRIAPTGLRLSTASLDAGTATVLAETVVVNDERAARSVTATVTLTDPSGRSAESAATAEVAAGTTVTISQRIVVEKAALWSPETPQLYSAHASIGSDQARDEFGIRTLTADARNGLQINGTTVKMRGAAIHHDGGVIGAHTLDAAEDRRIRILKAAGFNAIRSAHNPASRALLRACDRHGVLVMDELADAWFRPKVTFDYSRDFAEWWERDLEALVANDFNHPSVVMYSIGNEISDTVTERGIETNRAIARRTRELDPTRLVTNSINGFLNLIAPQDDEKLAAKAKEAEEKGENPNKNLIGVLNLIIGILDKMLEHIVRLPAVDKKTREIFADVDVAGYNYMVGRYKKDGTLHPERVIVGSETRGALTAEVWKQMEHLPYVIGDFAWTGWDYIGEAGLATKQYGTTKRQIFHPYPALLAGEPVIDITGFRQTQAYLDEIAWGLASGPHIAVEPVNHSGEKVVKTGWRATNSVDSWSWEGCEGRTATVEVYANAATVELSLNGARIGKRTVGENFLTTFTLPYAAGELTATAYAADGSTVGTRALTTAGPELQLTVEPETSSLIADGADLAYVPILLTDAAGTIRPLTDRSVTVRVEGAASLLGFGSAEAITTEGFCSDTHRTFYGRALAVVRAGHTAGDVTVTVTAEDCEPVTVTLSVTAPTNR